MLLSTILFVIGWAGFVDLIVWLVIAAIIYGILKWGLTELAIPDPFNKVIKAILIIAVVILLINAILSFVGAGFIPLHIHGR